MDNITKSLEDFLRRRGMDNTDIDGVEELDEIEYDRTMRAMLSGYETRVKNMVQEYNNTAEMILEVESLRATHTIRYYSLPGGEVGYAIIGRKKTGLIPDGNPT